MAEIRIQKGLAESLARLAAPQESFGMPVDLPKLARSLGVTEIVMEELTEDGRTIWDDRGPRIELRADRPEARTRFTLAHEIAHVLIERDQTVARRTQGLDHDEVETLCDWIAASILMPRDWVRRYAERSEYNLSLVRLVARRADVSLSAAAVRLAEVGGRVCMLLRLQRAQRRWLIVGHAAVPREYHGTLELTPESSLLIDNLANRRDTWQELSFTVPGQVLPAHTHIDRSGDTCLALVTSLDPMK